MSLVLRLFWKSLLFKEIIRRLSLKCNSGYIYAKNENTRAFLSSVTDQTNLNIDKKMLKIVLASFKWMMKLDGNCIMVRITNALESMGHRKGDRDDYYIPIEACQLRIGLLKKTYQVTPITIHSKILRKVKPSADLSSDATSLVPKETEKLIKYIEEGNAELAIDEISRLKKGLIRSLTLKTLTDLIDLCLQQNLTKNLSTNAHVMSYIIDNAKNVVKPVLEKYSAAGDVEKIILITNFIPDFSLKKIAVFDTYFAKAFIVSGKPENLLFYLEEHCGKNKLFSVAAFEELLDFPEFEDRIKKLAVKYLEMNFDLPLAIIWAKFYTKEMYDKADQLLKLYPKNHSCLVEMVGTKILKVIRENENVFMGQKFCNFIRMMDVKHQVKERAFCIVLDLLVLKEKYDDAVSLVLESETLQLQLYKHHLSTILTLKYALEKRNTPVPFHIPNKA